MISRLTDAWLDMLGLLLTTKNKMDIKRRFIETSLRTGLNVRRGLQRLVRVFNAITVILNGQWIFSAWLCDMYNAMDVVFSTASILNLFCISMYRWVSSLYQSQVTALIQRLVKLMTCVDEE